MARRWTRDEEDFYRQQLLELYIQKNKTIGQISTELGISEKSVFKRLGRLGIPSCPEKKANYLHKRNDIYIPTMRSADLAEFFGIMLGDGHVGHFQTMVTLGTKEIPYVTYVQFLMNSLFGVMPTIGTDVSGYSTVYIGSVDLGQWLYSEGLVPNKVKAQVGVPTWIFEQSNFMRAFIRGFFDTDGSVYKLRFGVQISLTNHSLPLLYALQDMLRRLGYRVSEVSAFRVYITRQADVERFFAEIQPMNTKHQVRYEHLTRRYPSG